MTAFRRILVPIDFSDASTAALAYARRLADGLQASLDVLHVVENPYPPAAFTEFPGLPPEFLERIEADARRDLDAALGAADRETYRARLVLRTGVAALEILSYLREHHDIDLVVMATHGRGGVSRLLLGSVADKIVRAAPCPVVTVRASVSTEVESGRAA